MYNQTEDLRVITPYSLIIVDDAIERYVLDSESKLKKTHKAGGVILEDWETASKVAFGLSGKSGETLSKPKGFPAPLFRPTNIPAWATILEGDF
jgi:hypothetical protein